MPAASLNLIRGQSGLGSLGEQPLASGGLASDISEPNPADAYTIEEIDAELLRRQGIEINPADSYSIEEIDKELIKRAAGSGKEMLSESLMPDEPPEPSLARLGGQFIEGGKGTIRDVGVATRDILGGTLQEQEQAFRGQVGADEGPYPYPPLGQAEAVQQAGGAVANLQALQSDPELEQVPAGFAGYLEHVFRGAGQVGLQAMPW